MRPTATIAFAALISAAPGIPACVLRLLPIWAVLALIGIGVLLTTVQVIITQVIRLHASARITRSQDALRVLEIEDLPRQRGRPRQPT
jgi:hypothetical protein